MYYAGWDGGGTKTAVCLINEEGTVCREAAFGPLNLNGASADTVRVTIQDALAFMQDTAGNLNACPALCVGMAGVSNRTASGFVTEALRSSGYTGTLLLRGDQEIALHGAIDGPGAILIAGTGSVLYGRDQEGRAFRTGGWGYLIDDAGSGYAIGRDILAACVRAYDGRLEKTCLLSMVLQQLSLSDIPGLITWLYAPGTGKAQIAALAPLLLTALATQDPVACRIADKAADDLCDMVTAGFASAGLAQGELALMGSIPAHYPQIRNRLHSRLASCLPALSLIHARRSPACGAAMLALEAMR